LYILQLCHHGNVKAVKRRFRWCISHVLWTMQKCSDLSILFWLFIFLIIYKSWQRCKSDMGAKKFNFIREKNGSHNPRLIMESAIKDLQCNFLCLFIIHLCHHGNVKDVKKRFRWHMNHVLQAMWKCQGLSILFWLSENQCSSAQTVTYIYVQLLQTKNNVCQNITGH